jgi:hypothetical protein
MKVFSKEMNKIGLSSAQAAKESAYLGSMLKGSGLSLEDTTDKTKDLVRLAGDLAATYGGPTSDAVRAIGSLMRGERDPIERYGVSLKQVDINAQMLTDAKNGLVFATEKEAAMNATLTLLYQKTGDAQGQAAREADSFAAKTAELQARMTDAQATIADALLPALVLVSEWFIDILPEVQKFGEGLVGALSDPEVDKAIKDMQYALGNLGLTIGTLFGSTQTEEAKGFMNFWIVLTGIINTLATLLSGLLAPIAAAFGNTKPMENWLDTILENVMKVVPYLFNSIPRPLPLGPGIVPGQAPQTNQITINTYNSNITAQEIYDKLRRLNKASGTAGGNFFQ